MRAHKVVTWFILFVLLVGMVSATTAAPPPPEPTRSAPGEVTAQKSGGSAVAFDPTGVAPIGIESVGSTTLANVTPTDLPVGMPFDLCFTVFVQSPDAEYMDYFDADLPDGWTINSVAPDSVPPANGCGGALPPVVGAAAGNVVYWQSTGYPPQTGCGAWNGSTGGANFDFCTNVTIPDATGAPWNLPWNYVGDGYGSAPHQVSGSYGPISPESAIMLTPPEIVTVGCPCEPQEHQLAVWNNAGYDTAVNLTYDLVSGTGKCSGPASVFVSNGGVATVTVGLNPVGSFGQVVACDVTAEDATDPANNDVSHIIKELISRFFDPAGWQLEPITGATPNQWAGGVVGSNPAAAGPVGYVVGGLAAGSSVINPDLQMYDPNTGTWTQLADLPNPRFSPAVGWIGGYLYAAGGYDAAFGATNDLQVYNPTSNTWDNTTPADMPNIRGGGAGGVGTCASGAGTCLFHVGGGPDSNFANTTLETWQYDLMTNGWTQLDNKPAGSSPDGFILGAGVGCLGRVYVGGDYRGYHEFYRLDATQPAGSQWTQLANIPANAGAMTPALVCKEDWGAIMLIGGDPDGYWGAYNNTVYLYDIASDTWEGPLAETLHVAQLGSVGWHMYDRVWTAGGTVGSGAIDPMPFESLAQINCDPDRCLQLFEVSKEARPAVEHGEVLSYTLIISATDLIPGMVLTDVLPAGVEYAGNLTWNEGHAWYSATLNAILWEYPGPAAGAAAAVHPSVPTVYDPASAADLANGLEAAAPPAPAVPAGSVALWAYPEAVLWDNGPLVTLPGACGGQDASRLQTGLAMNTLGFGHQVTAGNRMADDFEITDPAGWQIDTITFFAYQTNAPSTPSPITAVNYQIWNGPPDDPASVVVFGDTTTNRLLSSTFSNIQRDSETSPCANNRYIFADVASAGVTLPPGVYWLDWQTDGSLSSGPWAPPITILSQTTTGNALQYTDSSSAWGPANDSGTLTQQGMPFIIDGSLAGPILVEIAFDVTVTGHCGDVIANHGALRLDGVVKEFGAVTHVIGEADMTVNPAVLETALCPDATQELILTLCNQGDCPLSALVYELGPTAALAGSMPFVPVSVGAESILHPTGPAPQGLSLSSPAPKTLGRPEAPADPEAVLWDQPLSTVNQGAYVSQVFPDFSSYSSFLADDFVNTGRWQITSIFVPGDLWNGATDLHLADALTWQIYADSSGVPAGDPSGGGSPPVWTLTLPPNAPRVSITAGTPGGLPSNVALTLPTPIILPPGHWWLVFYPSAGFGAFGQYGRQPADTTNGYTGQFINPGGGFGLGTAWQNWTVLGPAEQDIAFRLEGNALPPAVDIPWLSGLPASRTVPRGQCRQVPLTFDASMLAPGYYTGDLMIVSNDPDTLTTTVTANLTVLEPVHGAAIHWSPTTPTVGETVHFTATVAGGTPPLVRSWDFGDGGTGSGRYVSHVYTAAGDYDVELTVDNACGQSVAVETVTVEARLYLPIVIKR